MKCNVGGMDMVARLIIGAVLLLVSLAVSISTTWQVILFVLALVALFTGAIRYCPLNALLGINTCSRKPKVLNKQ